MYTECPSCHTFFKISPNQLKAAEGKVRCGNCDEVFNALQTLVDTVPQSESESGQVESESKFLELEDSPVENELELVEESLGEPKDVESVESFADVKVPGMEASTGFETEVGPQEIPPMDLPDDIEEKNQTNPVVSEFDEINKDIDNALDDLFNDDELNADQKENLSEPQTAISAVSGLEDLEVELESSEAFSEKKSDMVLENLDDSAPTSGVNFTGVESLPETNEVAFDADKKTSQTKDYKDDKSGFDLSDSLVASSAEEMDPEEWEKSEASDDVMSEVSGDSYILEELDEPAPASSGIMSKTIWSLIIIILLVVLTIQFAYLKRATLVKYPAAKPAVEAMCGMLNYLFECEVPEPRDVSNINLLERNVITHPNAKNALLITSTIRNNANFEQPFPSMVLTFSDINQKVIARRSFVPDEYLAKEVDQSQGMDIDVPYKVMLEIVDPGEEAVNFEFDFR